MDVDCGCDEDDDDDGLGMDAEEHDYHTRILLRDVTKYIEHAG